jgi:hypothetical protein
VAEIKLARTGPGRFSVVAESAGAVGCVRFEVDWGHEWPLWGPCDETYPMEPSELNLSQALIAQLRAFYEYWEEHYPFEKGWDSIEHCRHAHVEADRLTALVATELRGRYVVVNGFTETFPCTAHLILAR